MSARYWRINTTSNVYGSNVAWAEIAMTRTDGTAAPIGGPFCSAGDPTQGIDTNTSTAWAATGALPAYWGYYQYLPYIVQEVVITAPTGGTAYNQAPGTFSIDHSDDGSTWTTAQTFTSSTWTTSGQVQTFEITTTQTAHQYWRINVTANQSSSNAAFAEIAFNNTTGGTSPCHNGASYSGSVFAPAYEGCDGSARIWVQNGGFPCAWVYDFGSGNPQSIASVTLTAGGPDTTTATHTPGTFTLDYSNDNSTWTTAGHFTAAAWTAGSVQTFTVVANPVTVWNSYDSAAGITLSTDALTATASGSTLGWRSMRATTSQSTGKYVFEFKTHTDSDQSIMVGLANASADLTTYIGHNANGVAYDPNMSGGATGFYGNGGFINTLGTSTNDTWTMLAVDLGAKLIWFYSPHDGEWNASSTANPATGTGGISLSWLTGPLFPAFATYGDAADPVYAVANFSGGFSNAVPSGFAAWGAEPVSWNANDCGANIAISGAGTNLLASASGSTPGWRSVRASSSHSSSDASTKLYFEMTVATTSGGYVIIGAGTTSAALTSYAGSDSNSFGYQVNPSGSAAASYYISGSGSVHGSAANGVTIGVAIDLVNKLVWFHSPTDGFWNGSGTSNPATGALGLSFSAVSGALFPMASFYGQASDSISVLANFGQSTFAGTMPSGFTAWDTPPISGAIVTGQVLEVASALNYLAPNTTEPQGWNSADSGRDITVGGTNNLLATTAGTSLGWRSMRATHAHNQTESNTKLYFEAQVVTNTATSIMVGWANSLAPLTNYLGSDVNGFGYVPDPSGGSSNYYANGGTRTSLGHSSNSTWLGFAIDLVARKGWIYSSTDGYWNGSSSASPATGVGGLDLSYITGAIYPATSTNGIASNAISVLLNLGASSFAHSLPSGFTGWDVSASAPYATVTGQVLEVATSLTVPPRVTGQVLEVATPLILPPRVSGMVMEVAVGLTLPFLASADTSSKLRFRSSPSRAGGRGRRAAPMFG